VAKATFSEIFNNAVSKNMEGKNFSYEELNAIEKGRILIQLNNKNLPIALNITLIFQRICPI